MSTPCFLSALFLGLLVLDNCNYEDSSFSYQGQNIHNLVLLNEQLWRFSQKFSRLPSSEVELWDFVKKSDLIRDVDQLTFYYEPISARKKHWEFVFHETDGLVSIRTGLYKYDRETIQMELVPSEVINVIGSDGELLRTYEVVRDYGQSE